MTYRGNQQTIKDLGFEQRERVAEGTDLSAVDALHGHLDGVGGHLSLVGHVVDEDAEAGRHLGRHGQRDGLHGRAAGVVHRHPVPVDHQVLTQHLGMWGEVMDWR